MANGLDKDGGISFGRKKNFEDKKQDELVKVQEPKRIDIEELNRKERLESKLKTAKRVNYSGFAFNSGSVLFLLYGINSIAHNPDTIEMVELLSTTFNIEFDYVGFLEKVEKFKTHLIASCGSIQLFLGANQQLRRKMRDADREDTWNFVNEELERIGL